MLKVLVTGITGFLGSHIAESLIQSNFRIIGLKRSESDIWRCQEFEEQIDWVDIDGSWKNSIIEKSPNIIIHSAWIGVEAKDRDNWETQVKNLPFLVELLEIAKALNVDKFVFLGSQAEYGNINGKVAEERAVSALNAYGSVKLASLELLKSFCQLNHINWVWLRLFSLFGEKENDNWLIPSVVKAMLNSSEMDLTEGAQKYAYLYVKDFAEILQKVLKNEMISGVYNVSSNEVQSLRALLEMIRHQVNPKFQLKFGKIPYRDNQSMHIEGDISKITKQIGPIKFTDFNVALQKTLNFYQKNNVK
ncbi:NAD-dependent epimerase/dehydratase family protein [Pedobacter sp. PWIIR3]